MMELVGEAVHTRVYAINTCTLYTRQKPTSYCTHKFVFILFLLCLHQLLSKPWRKKGSTQLDGYIPLWLLFLQTSVSVVTNSDKQTLNVSSPDKLFVFHLLALFLAVIYEVSNREEAYGPHLELALKTYCVNTSIMW